MMNMVPWAGFYIIEQSRFIIFVQIFFKNKFIDFNPNPIKFNLVNHIMS
jgi:hypothetical protein